MFTFYALSSRCLVHGSVNAGTPDAAIGQDPHADVTASDAFGEVIHFIGSRSGSL
jgi:hypothetical protein